MQILHASALNGVTPVQYPVIQSVARNVWIDVNNESAVTLTVSLGGRIYLIPPNTTARYAMDNTETFVMFTPQSTADPTKDSVSGTIYNEQDSIPVEIERGANASDILPITSAMIADGAVIAAKVATNAINTANIVAGAVGTTQLANGSVTNPILASLAVATGNVQSGAIGTTQLGNGAVTNPILASLAVANANIQANAVNTTQIATGAVTTTKIANLAVTTALIANAAVGTAQIATAAITTALIQTAAITDALIANVSAGKITAGTISAAISIIAPTITGGLFQTATSGQRIEISSSNLDRIKYFTGLAGETNPAQVLWGNSLQLLAAQFTAATPAQIQLFSDYLGGVPQTTVEGAVVRLQADSFGVGGGGRSIQMDGRSGGGIVLSGGSIGLDSNRLYTVGFGDNNHFLEGGGGNALWQAFNSISLRTTQFDVQEQVGAGSAVCRTVNAAASGYREHDASVHTNISDIRLKDIKEIAHPPGHHRDIIRQVGKPFKFNWKEGHGDNGKHSRWGLSAQDLPAEFTKQEKLGKISVYAVDPQSMIAVLFGAVNDLIDDIELLKGSK